jgi:hypothetical protein
MRVSDLNEHQKQHLVWRLDRYTGCGLLTAMTVARGEIHTDKTLEEIFEWTGTTPRSAKHHARKVTEFTQDPKKAEVARVSIQLYQHCITEMRGLDGKETQEIARNMIRAFRGLLDLYRAVE